jgi:hypothetical protein
MTDIPPPTHRPMWRIVVAMAVVIGCLVATMVLIAVNETNTQRNADRQSADNQELRAELRCRAAPQLRYDQADAILSALIAETIADLGQLTPEEIEQRRIAVRQAITNVRAALDDRDEALIACSTPST